MGAKILIIEDNPIDLKIAVAIAENAGHTVLTAADGLLGLQALAEHGDDLDLVVVDLQMPRITGVDFLQRMRGSRRYPHLPVLVMSARNEMRDVRLAVTVGANDYMVKPVDEMVFQSKIKTMTGTRPDEWAQYSFDPQVDECGIQIQCAGKILTISEVAVTLRSPAPLAEGATTLLDGRVFSEMGIKEAIYCRVDSCAREGDGFTARLSFLALNEQVRRRIRMFCREQWAKRKQNGAEKGA